MFTIYGDNTKFNQWDLNQRVTEPSLVAGDRVVFLNSSGLTIPMEAYYHNNTLVVDVPNKLLTMAIPILVYINGRYDTRTRFSVNAQVKPEGYVFADNTTRLPVDRVDRINLSDYGINLPSFILRGGGTMTVTDKALAKKLWERINSVEEFRFVCEIGQAFELTPTVKVFDSSCYVVGVGFNLCTYHLATNSLMVANIMVCTNTNKVDDVTTSDGVCNTYATVTSTAV